MANLVAHYLPPGGHERHLWSHPLRLLEEVTIGQTNAPAVAPPNRADLGLTGAPKADRNLVSPIHVTVEWDGDDLKVRLRDPAPRNPVVWLGGETQAAGAEFRIKPDQAFSIRDKERVWDLFRFTLKADAPAPPLPPPTEDPYQYVTRPLAAARPPADTGFVNLRGVTDLLARLVASGKLPGQGAVEAAGREVLDAVGKILPSSVAAAFVTLRDGNNSTLGVERTHPENAPPPPISRKLVADAVRTGTAVVASWSGGGGAGMTAALGVDWALAVPLPADHAQAVKEVLYVIGTGDRFTADDPALAQARELLQLIADVYASVRRVRQQTQVNLKLSEFLPSQFRKFVRDNLVGLDAALEPKVRPVTVLFCDLRGFTTLSELYDGKVDEFWNEVLREAVQKMADPITNNLGLIASYLGDAVMGFWGWPKGHSDDPGNAAAAALQVAKDFRRRNGHSQADVPKLACGVGIATGPAVVGKLGTDVQAKFDVIGPIVNLASRLEGLTKKFGVECLTDAPTYRGVEAWGRKLEARGVDPPRTRRIGWVMPAGVTVPVEVYELMPGWSDNTFHTADTGAIKANARTDYDRAVGEFEAGDWGKARTALAVPVQAGDGPSLFLTEFIGPPRRPARQVAPQ
jgi:class 3 adenylate cyclase